MADFPAPPSEVLALLAAAVPDMQARAAGLDREEAFPEQDITLLISLGLLTAPLPRRLGGLGAGTEPEGCQLLFSILRTIGQGNMAVGRLFEAHVNAVKLIVDYGDAGQVQQMAGHVRAGSHVRRLGHGPARRRAWCCATARCRARRGRAPAPGTSRARWSRSRPGRARAWRRSAPTARSRSGRCAACCTGCAPASTAGCAWTASGCPWQT